MKTIKQSSPTSCAIACVSMITGIPELKLVQQYGLDELKENGEVFYFWEVIKVVKVLLDCGFQYGCIFTFPEPIKNDTEEISFSLRIDDFPRS